MTEGQIKTGTGPRSDREGQRKRQIKQQRELKGEAGIRVSQKRARD